MLEVGRLEGAAAEHAGGEWSIGGESSGIGDSSTSGRESSVGSSGESHRVGGTQRVGLGRCRHRVRVEVVVLDRTSIEWTDASWSPVSGCTRVSEGCRHCYAERMAGRFSGPGKPYEGVARMTPEGGRWTGEVKLHPERLGLPFHWKRPRRIFVCSMSDLFHPKVPFEFVDKIFAMMAWNPRHTFQVLTKRPERMAEYVNGPSRKDSVWTVPVAEYARGKHITTERYGAWPLRNVWLGTSVEDQVAADARIPYLLETPAAVRFLSCEPLLGPINLEPWLWKANVAKNWPDGTPSFELVNHAEPRGSLGWLIAGGESGPGARPMAAEWVRSLRDQCQVAGVAFFFKQVGGVRKKIAGRVLDGRTWDEFPGVRVVAA